MTAALAALIAAIHPMSSGVGGALAGSGATGGVGACVSFVGVGAAITAMVPHPASHWPHDHRREP
jgi:hypothetical protein